MIVFRVIAIVALGLIVAMVLVTLSKGADANFASEVGMLVFLSLLILVLGPFWPSQKNLDKWADKSKFNLPTDNPAVALYVLNFAGALFCLYFAWNHYAHPLSSLGRFGRLAQSIAGPAGPVAMWLILAIACVIGGIVTYRKAVKAKKSDPPV